jgi:integrase
VSSKRKGRKKGRQTNRGRRFPPETLTPGEVFRLMDACGDRSITSRRNRVLIATLYRAGLRISEALSLLPKDIDLETGTIRVLRGKGGKFRVIGIDRCAAEMIRDWISQRAALAPGVGSTLFCTCSGRRMSTSYVRQLLPRLARRAGIEKRVHPHGLRHTHAAELAAENMPLNMIQAQLGHSNAATTSRYIQHIAPHRLIASMWGRSWPAG